MDHISLSGSLLSILSYIDHKDIRNAQLVSRRFHHLINSNALHLPRPRTRLTIATVPYKDLTSARDFITIQYGNCVQKTSICITDETIRVYKGARKDMTDYLDQNGAASVVDQSNEDTAFFQNITGGERVLPWFFASEKEKDYLSGGIENGLSLVMTLILRQYHFESVTIYNGYYVADSREARWLRSIVQMARKSLTFSKGLQFWRAWSGMGLLFNGFNCQYVRVLCEPREPFADFLPNLEVFNGFLRLRLRVTRTEWIDSLQALVEFIKRWEAGRSRIARFDIYSRSSVHIKYSHSDFLAAMGSNFHVVFSKLENEARERAEHVEMVIARPEDEVLLCLKYCRSHSQIAMADTAWTGEQPPNVSSILTIV